jgi:hypothetical protein
VGRTFERRRGALGGILMKRALLFFVLAAGCSFPTIDRVVPADGSSGEDTGNLSDSISAGDTEDSSTSDSTVGDSGEVDSAIDTMKPDTFVPGSDTGMCKSGSLGTDPCDCDADGYKRADSACGGDDCDDDDARANPGVKMFSTFAPTMKTNGDWNCDGIPKKKYNENISCGALLGDCTVQGFTTTVKCGATGTYITCKVVPLGCATNTTGTQTQACL